MVRRSHRMRRRAYPWPRGERSRAIAVTVFLKVGIALLLLAATTPAAAQSRVGVHFFGASVHFLGTVCADELNQPIPCRSFDPGVGVEYVAHQGERLFLTLDAGVYRDSTGIRNVFGGVVFR